MQVDDIVITEKSEETIIVTVGQDRYRINSTPDSSWEAVLDRTYMNQDQFLAWLKDNL